MIKLENLKTTQITDSFKANMAAVLRDRLMMAKSHKERDLLRKAITERGQDRTLTSLKRLPYQKFSYIRSPQGVPYFCGETDDLIYKLDGDDYNVGPYYVCVSRGSILNRQNHPVHLFPKYNPNTPHRHLHHFADGSYDNPLDASPRTCWADVGPTYLSAVTDCSFVDIFRVLYIFLQRLNWGSPYDRAWKIEAMSHGERL